MFRATADGKNGPLAILGLSAENVKRLQAGQPIHVPAKSEIGLNKGLILFYGETEHQMMNEIRALIGPDTKAHIDPKLGES